MLRLLLVTDAVGGVWVYSLELARALKPLGIETVLAVMGPSPTAKQREESAGIKLIDTGLPLDWLETSASELRRAAEKVAALAFIEGADIVQTNSAALLADGAFDQPCISVQHSCVASWWAAVKGTPLPHPFVWRREFVQRGLERAAMVVAPSIAFAGETARIYDIGAPVVAVHNGRRPVLGPATGQANFVFTASRLWDEGKNVATLDAAAARLSVSFEAAGPQHGPNGAHARLKHIRALGEIGSARLANLLAARPVFASAALYEPFGLSVLEAALSGCALVLGDVPSLREIWGDSATFVPADDAVAIARAINWLCDDDGLRRARGARARARAQMLTPERMAREYDALYRALREARATAGTMERLACAS